MSARSSQTFLSYELQILGMAFRAQRQTRGVTRRQAIKAIDANPGNIKRAFTRLEDLGLLDGRPEHTGLGGNPPLAYYLTELGDKTFRNEMEAIFGEQDWLRFRRRALRERD